MRRGTIARLAGSVWARDWALPRSPSSDYAFLVDRLIDRATLDRAEALAKKWGVLPHAVMIANGWLSESDYYRALARASGVPFQIAPHEVTAPASLKSPRACLARGLLKRRARDTAPMSTHLKGWVQARSSMCWASSSRTGFRSPRRRQ